MHTNSTRIGLAMALVIGLLVACQGDPRPADDRVAPTVDAQVAPAEDAQVAPTEDAQVHEGAGGDSGAPEQDAGPQNDACADAMEGTYAIRSEVDTWFGTPDVSSSLVKHQRSKVVVYLEARLQRARGNEQALVARIRPCGFEMPVLTTDLWCAAWQLTVDEQAWDHPSMPRHEVRVTPEGSTAALPGPNDALVLDDTRLLVGIDTVAPEERWPSTLLPEIECPVGRRGEDCFLDHDGDGFPGITWQLRTEGVHRPDGCQTFAPTEPEGGHPYTFRDLPADIVLAEFGDPVWARADRVYGGLRIQLGTTGVVGSDCRVEGALVNVTGFDVRAASCNLSYVHPWAGYESCTPNHVELIDYMYLRDWNVLQAGERPPESSLLEALHPSDGPQTSTVKLGGLDTVSSCTAVRDAFALDNAQP